MMATIKFGLEWGDKVSLKVQDGRIVAKFHEGIYDGEEWVEWVEMDPHRIISHILRLQDKNAKTPSMIREE